MITRQPVCTQHFHCLGGACPDTCCRDWSIVPDEGALTDYEGAPEPLRSLIQSSLTRDDDGDVCFRLREDGFCALLTPEGLCPIQRDWGEEHLCVHCGAYPRFTEEYGPLSETVLAISCPEAARLLLEGADFSLAEEDDGVDTSPLEGVDANLLAVLEDSRGKALAVLGERERPIWARLGSVIAYAADLQDCIDFGAWAAAGECAPAPWEGGEGPRFELTARLLALCAGLESLRPAWPELLHRRCEELLELGPEGGELCAAFGKANPGWEEHLTRFASYLVFRHWHKTVNDDGLYGRAALVGAACLMVYHLCLLHWREHGALTPGDEIALWSAFSREIEHLDENLAILINTLFDRETWPILA